LYLFLGLLLAGLAPKFHSFSGWLGFGTSLSALCLSVWGYLKGVHAEGKTFTTETLCLTTGSATNHPCHAQQFGLVCLFLRSCCDCFTKGLALSGDFQFVSILVLLVDCHCGQTESIDQIDNLGRHDSYSQGCSASWSIARHSVLFFNFLLSMVLGRTAGKFMNWLRLFLLSTHICIQHASQFSLTTHSLPTT
jgi:hypothetical protein